MPKYAAPPGMARVELVIDAAVLAAGKKLAGPSGLSALVERMLAAETEVSPKSTRQPVGYPAGKPRKTPPASD